MKLRSGVKLVGVYFIMAGLLSSVFLPSFAASAGIKQLINQSPGLEVMKIASWLILAGFVTGIGLIRLWKWARWTAMVIASCWIIWQVVAVVWVSSAMGSFVLFGVFNVFVLLYLSRPSVKAQFQNR